MANIRRICVLTLISVMENIRDLALRLDAPLLGIMPYMHGHHPSRAAGVLNVVPLL